MRYTLVLSALLVGVGLSASAAPKHGAHTTPQKHAATRTPVILTPIAVDRPERAMPGGFRDVPPDHWAARAVETLRRQGIVKGYPDNGK